MINQDVFHIRLKNIELQAERLLDSSLRTRAVAIISSGCSNGSIVSLSSEAEEEGLYLGMKVYHLRNISRSIQLLPYNCSLYNRLSRYVYQTISMFTPTIEPDGINSFYLDMKGMKKLYGSMHNIGMSIIQRIHNQTNISGIIGISINKLVSRIVTSVIPETIHKVDRGKEAQFLSTLDPHILPTVKENSVNRLIHFLWINKISHIQSMASHPDEFRTFFGSYAAQLSREAYGYDSSLVRPPQLQDHILEQTILPEDTNDDNILYATVKDLGEQLGFKLRTRKQIAKKVKLEIHYSDGYQKARTGQICNIDDKSVIKVCEKLFEKTNGRRNRIRAILLDVSEFVPYVNQQNLFSVIDNKDMALSKAVDTIRTKYGLHSLQTADVAQSLGRI